jgi:hypothetical protein
MDYSITFPAVDCGLLLVHNASFMSLPSIRINIQTLKTNIKFSLKQNTVTSKLLIYHQSVSACTMFMMH